MNSGLCVSQQCNGKTIVICKYSSSDTGLCIYVSLVKEISEKPGNVGNRVHVLCGNILLALNSTCSIPRSILETWLTNFYWITAVETNLFNLLEETQNSWGAWGQTRRWSETYKDWTTQRSLLNPPDNTLNHGSESTGALQVDDPANPTRTPAASCCLFTGTSPSATHEWRHHRSPMSVANIKHV